MLQRRRKSVKINKEETLLILRAYINHPTSWPEILDEVKQNLNILSPAAMEVYTTGSLRQLRDRMSGKLNFLIKKTPEDIPDADIRYVTSIIEVNYKQCMVSVHMLTYIQGKRDLFTCFYLRFQQYVRYIQR